MREPAASPGGAPSPSLHVLEVALRLLEAAGISPLSRPRVLAAARACGASLALNEWYEGAWQLEAAGKYLRRGNDEHEWLEPLPER